MADWLAFYKIPQITTKYCIKCGKIYSILKWKNKNVERGVILVWGTTSSNLVLMSVESHTGLFDAVVRGDIKVPRHSIEIIFLTFHCRL
jgi:hypothetical protein